MPSITLGVADRRKFGGDEGSGTVLPGGFCEGLSMATLNMGVNILRNHNFDVK